LGLATDLVRGDIYYWGKLMARVLIASVPSPSPSVFLDGFISGITGGAAKYPSFLSSIGPVVEGVPPPSHSSKPRLHERVDAASTAVN